MWEKQGPSKLKMLKSRFQSDFNELNSLGKGQSADGDKYLPR